MTGGGEVDRIVVQTPLSLPVLTRVLAALSFEFPDGRLLDDPDGHLVIEVSVYGPSSDVAVDVPVDGWGGS